MKRLGLSCKVNECKPLPASVSSVRLPSSFLEMDTGLTPLCTFTQGLTLVHISAQLEPCLTQENTLHTLNTP